MRQFVESPENPLPVHLRNKWPLANPGHIAEQLSGPATWKQLSGPAAWAQLSGGVGRWPGQRVGHHVVHTRHVADIRCKFRHVGQLSALHRCPAISHLALGIGKWLMVRVDCEWPSL